MADTSAQRQRNNVDFSAREFDITEAVTGESLVIGDGFTAVSFKERHFGGLMDPLLMVDHYTMSEPTFGPHPHAGIAAVSVLFESSSGQFNNRDTLGNDLDLQPGDLYWLNAGRGALHDEAPRAGARIEGLQVFVNLPAQMKHRPPSALHVKAASIPLVEGAGYRVRVVMGESGGVRGARAPTRPLTVLDGHLAAGARYTHLLPVQHSGWLYAVRGDLEVTVGRRSVRLPAGRALAIGNRSTSAELAVEFANTSTADGQFALFSGAPVGEYFVQQGPFAMSSREELQQVQEDYAAGRLGTL
ncbi:pirin family protein [Microbulbifer litoralis]|uniref:pirin family protein n=1 Tax=Microbulbifer litoralis TaxID=2933965 RepID=UPI002027A3F1|nr:pirin-like C-terminal cupin domain-containing protein [Microbulbifer sp. GX H0434]